MQRAEGKFTVICRRLCIAAGVALIVMMSLVVCNIISRTVYKPIFGTYEIVRYLGLMIVIFGMAYTQLERTHISVDLLTSRLHKRVRIALEIINGLVLCSLAALVAYHMFLYALKLMHTQTVTPTLQLPLHIFVLGLALSFLSLGIVTIWQLLHSFKGFKK